MTQSKNHFSTALHSVTELPKDSFFDSIIKLNHFSIDSLSSTSTLLFQHRDSPDGLSFLDWIINLRHTRGRQTRSIMVSLSKNNDSVEECTLRLNHHSSTRNVFFDEECILRQGMIQEWVEKWVIPRCQGMLHCSSESFPHRLCISRLNHHSSRHS